MNDQRATQMEQPDQVEAWIQRSLAKPGGHGPITREQQAVLASVFGQSVPRPEAVA